MSKISRYDEMPTIVGVYRQNRRLATLSLMYRLQKVDFPLSRKFPFMKTVGQKNNICFSCVCVCVVKKRVYQTRNYFSLGTVD